MLLPRGPRYLGPLALGRERRRRGLGGHFGLFGRLLAHRLDAPCERVVRLHADDRVLQRGVHLGVASDLAGLDSAAAHVLPPRDVGAAQGMRPKTGEVEAEVLRIVGILFDRARSVLERLADARVPPGLRQVHILREDPIIGPASLEAGDPLFVLLRQHAERQRASLRSRGDKGTNDALYSLNRSGVGSTEVAISAPLALGLAMVGVIGMVSYAVARLTNEIGIRMVVGARPSTILAMFTREMLAL